MPAWLAPALAAGGSLLGGIFGAASDNANNKRTIAANKELAELQFRHDRDMWNLNNQYNDPKAQMARLKGAGLNPNLIYGSGSAAAAGNSSSYPKYNAPQVEYRRRTGLEGIGTLLPAFQDAKMQMAQYSAVQASEENTRARTATEIANAALKALQGVKAGVDIARGREDLRHRKNINPLKEDIASSQTVAAKYAAQSGEAKLRQEWAKVALQTAAQTLANLKNDAARKNLTTIDLQQEKLAAEILYRRYQNEWRKEGVTESDSPIIRMIVRKMHEYGYSVKEMIDRGMFDLKTWLEQVKAERESKNAEKVYRESIGE